MSATANVLTSRPAVSGAERSVPLTQATNILDWAATAPSFSAASPMSSRGQLGSAFNPPTGPSQASHPSQGGTLLPSDGSPPPGRAAFDYYTAQSDYIQSMMQSQAHASRITPHIIIKGQGQPVQTLQGHSQYPPESGSMQQQHQGQQRPDAQAFESSLEHDDEFLNSFQLPPLNSTGGIEGARAHPPSHPAPSMGFANMPLHLVDRDFESLPAELPSHIMDRLMLPEESPAASPHTHLPAAHPGAAHPGPSHADPASARPTLARTLSAPSGGDLDWGTPEPREQAPTPSPHSQHQPLGPAHAQPQHRTQQQLNQGPGGPQLEAPGGASAQAQPPSPMRGGSGGLPEPQRLLLGCSAELREFAARADIDQLHKVYLTPASKRKGKGGRQPATDPRLDPSVDPKKARRILANRLSAARSKMKQRSQVDEIQRQIESLETQKAAIQDDIASLQAACNEHVQINGQLAHRLQVLQEHHRAQSHEHAQLLEAHAKLGIAPPSAGSHQLAGPPQQPLQQQQGNLAAAEPMHSPAPPMRSPAPPMHSPAPVGGPPAQPERRVPTPLQDAGGLSAVAPAAGPRYDVPGARDAPDLSTITRDRLVQELQRFDLPQELRQMLMSMPVQAARQQN